MVELQLMDNSSPDALIRAIEAADSPGRLIAAVRALANSRSPEGLSTLIRVLGFNNPGAAVTAMNGLIQMGDQAVPALLQQIDGYNYGARSYSIRALAAIADPQALTVLLNAAATDFAPSVRRAASKGLGSMRWSGLPVDQIDSAQQQTWQTLQQVIQDADWSIRYAAMFGFEGLAIAAKTSSLAQEIAAYLKTITVQDKELAVQARAQLALDRIGQQRQIQA